MNGLSMFEAMAEEFVEGTLSRMLGGRLQPVDMANSLARALEDGQAVGVEGHALAPNRFVVLVNSEDYRALQTSLEALQEQLTTYVTRLAVQKRMGIVGCLQVTIQPSPSVPMARARVSTSTDTPKSPDSGQDTTRPIPIVRRKTPSHDGSCHSP